MGPIYSLETFIVNLVGGRGKNYLKAKVELELDSEKTISEIERTERYAVRPASVPCSLPPPHHKGKTCSANILSIFS